MNIQPKHTRVFHVAGLVAFIAGAIDPLELSFLIGIGALLITLAAYLQQNRYRKWLLISTLMIVVGIAFMFYLSSLGGFGGNSSLSWWWGLLMAPYPAGWAMMIVALILRYVKRKKNLDSNHETQVL